VWCGVVWLGSHLAFSNGGEGSGLERCSGRLGGREVVGDVRAMSGSRGSMVPLGYLSIVCPWSGGERIDWPVSQPVSQSTDDIPRPLSAGQYGTYYPSTGSTLRRPGNCLLRDVTKVHAIRM
jgi:hypothetical protein